MTATIKSKNAIDLHQLARSAIEKLVSTDPPRLGISSVCKITGVSESWLSTQVFKGNLSAIVEKRVSVRKAYSVLKYLNRRGYTWKQMSRWSVEGLPLEVVDHIVDFYADVSSYPKQIAKDVQQAGGAKRLITTRLNDNEGTNNTMAQPTSLDVNQILDGIDQEMLGKTDEAEIYLSHEGVAQLTGIASRSWTQNLVNLQKALDQAPEGHPKLDTNMLRGPINYLSEQGYSLQEIASWTRRGTPLSAVDLTVEYYAKPHNGSKPRDRAKAVLEAGNAKQLVEAYLAAKSNGHNNGKATDTQKALETIADYSRTDDTLQRIVSYAQKANQIQAIQEELERTRQEADSRYKALEEEGLKPDSFSKALTLLRESGFDVSIVQQNRVVNIQLVFKED